MILIINFLTAFLTAYVVSRAEIFEAIIQLLDKKTKDKYSIPFAFLAHLVTCFSCLSFWLTVVFIGDFLLASVGFIAAKIYDKYLSKWEDVSV